MAKQVNGSEAFRGKPPILNITLPLPPGINSQYATVEGRRVLSESARKWKCQVKQKIEALETSEVLSESLIAELKRSYLSVFMEFYFPTPHRRDLDGGLKIALDALSESLGLNDNRVVEIHLIKLIDPLQPHLEISLEGIKNWEFDEQYILLEESE